jgi:AcrR family transcriptional regulator
VSPKNVQFTREDIVDAAFRLVREGGWEAFSVPAVAKAIGSSTMPIYSQFANARELEDAVAVKALKLLKERMLEKISGDVWIDQAITFLRFAVEEKFLYRTLWDGRNPELQKDCGIDLWKFIDEQLVGYEPLARLSPADYRMVRFTRSLMAQGLAATLNMDRRILLETGLTVEEYVRKASFAILEGFGGTPPT